MKARPLEDLQLFSCQYLSVQWPIVLGHFVQKIVYREIFSYVCTKAAKLCWTLLKNVTQGADWCRHTLPIANFTPALSSVWESYQLSIMQLNSHFSQILCQTFPTLLKSSAHLSLPSNPENYLISLKEKSWTFHCPGYVLRPSFPSSCWVEEDLTSLLCTWSATNLHFGSFPL